LERHLADHKQDMVNLVILGRTLYQYISADKSRVWHPSQAEIIKLLNGLHSRFDIDLSKTL
jgi:hypothetical protein